MKHLIFSVLLLLGPITFAADFKIFNISPVGQFITSNQCSRMMGPDVVSEETCSAASAWMWRSLSFHVLVRPNGATYGAAFPTTLVKLLKSENVLGYLSKLNAALDSSTSTHSEFNLYDFTFKESKSKEVAVKWIAVLFQDFAEQSHIPYLAYHYPELSNERDLLVSVLNKLKDNSLVQFYPQETGRLQGSHYHFYVIAYLAANIPSSGLSDSVRATTPFIMNATYEFLKTYETSDHPSLNLMLTQTQNFWREISGLVKCILPSNLDSETPSLNDIYLGYIGPRWMLGLRSLSLAEFKQTFTQNPREFFRLQLIR